MRYSWIKNWSVFSVTESVTWSRDYTVDYLELSVKYKSGI